MAGDAADRVKLKLKEQVEFYLSPRNLQTDFYLYSKMDSKLRVPLDVVASFPRIRDLCQSKEELVDIVKSSDVLRLDEDSSEMLIAPANIKPALRTTVILREVPDDVTDEELLAIFTTKPATIKREVNNMRFLVFSTEEETSAMHRLAISSKLRDQPIRARIKNESMGINMLVAKHEIAEHIQHEAQQHFHHHHHHHHHHQHHQHQHQGHYGMMFADPFSGYAQDTSGYSSPHWFPCSYTSYLQQMKMDGKGGKGMGKKGMKGGKKGGKKGPPPQVQAEEKKPVFTAEDFPTLVQADGLYEKEVIKWSKEEIISKLEAFGNKLKASASLAASLKPELAGCGVALATPDYSIELIKPVKKKDTDFLEAAKKGNKKKAVMSAVSETDTPKEKPLEEEKKEEEPKAEPVAEATPAEEDNSEDRKKTFAEAVVHAQDVRVPSTPFLQYRAGLTGGTLVVPGGSVQKSTQPVDKKTKKEGKGSKGESKGRGGRGAEGRGGRGSGKKGGDQGEKKRRKGEGKGSKKGTPQTSPAEEPSKKPTMRVEEPQEATAPAPAQTSAGSAPSASWADVAKRLAKDEQ